MNTYPYYLRSVRCADDIDWMRVDFEDPPSDGCLDAPEFFPAGSHVTTGEQRLTLRPIYPADYGF